MGSNTPPGRDSESEADDAVTGEPGGLLAVDLGLRTGLARFDAAGRLVWYRSRNFGRLQRMRRAVFRVLDEAAPLTWLFGEGDRRLFEIWERPARKRGIQSRLVAAETWRRDVLYRRERRRGAEAKRHADQLARAVIEWSGAKRPTSLRHDAAEAILLGLWAVLELKWLDGGALDLRGLLG